MADSSSLQVGPYIIGQCIGRGSVGYVYEATHRPSKTKVAMKVIDRADMVDPALGKRLRREIAVMKMIKHPHVVSARDVLKNSRRIYIAMDLVSGGELFTEIMSKGKLSEDEARKYMCQLIDGLSYCHHQGIVHRNLKPEKLLLDKDKNLKITDFGVANFLTIGRAGGQALLSTKVGSHDYVAPEVLTQQRYRGQPTDVWSCGVILYAMLAGMLPFEAGNTNALFRKICSADFFCPDWFSDQAADLLHKMLVVNPDKRIKIEDICAEPWFKGTKLATHEPVLVNDEQVDGAFVQVEDTASSAESEPSKATPPPKPGPVESRMRDFRMIGLLGQGAFSRVFKCVHLPTDKEYAMKIISKRVIKKKSSGERMDREIAIMKMLWHPHVVVMHQALASAVELFLVLDLVAGGSIRDALDDCGKFTEARAKRYMLQLFDGLGYCHSRGVCHRDLKPANLMLDIHDNLKIADFGLGNFIIGEQLLYTRCGTPHYVAPEVIAHQGRGYDGKGADIWSCGVIIYCMLAGRVPFDAKTTPLLYNRIRIAYYYMPDDFSDDAQDLLRQLLVPKPSKRLTLEKAMVQPWFKEELRKSVGIKTLHSIKFLDPSELSIATAIKPVLRQNTFKMEATSTAKKSVHAATPYMVTTPATTATTATPTAADAAAYAIPASATPAAASAAAAAASTGSLPPSRGHASSTASIASVYSAASSDGDYPDRPSKLRLDLPTGVYFCQDVKILCKKHRLRMYKTLYKRADVSVDSTKLNIVIGNEAVTEGPFPLLFSATYTARIATYGALVIKLPNSVAPMPKYYRFKWNSGSADEKATARRICERILAMATPVNDGAFARGGLTPHTPHTPHTPAITPSAPEDTPFETPDQQTDPKKKKR